MLHTFLFTFLYNDPSQNMGSICGVLLVNVNTVKTLDRHVRPVNYKLYILLPALLFTVFNDCVVFDNNTKEKPKYQLLCVYCVQLQKYELHYRVN